MAIQLQVDLETQLGPTQEAYFRVDSYRVNKVLGELKFVISSWIDKESADNFKREYYDSPTKNAHGLLANKVIYFENEDSDGEEIELGNFFAVPLTVEKEVELPIYEEKTVTKEIPYISFDEMGDEITLYETKEVKEKVKTGVEKITKQVIVGEGELNPIELCYTTLEKEFAKHFPKDKIKRI